MASQSAAGRHEGRLRLAFLLTASFMAVEAAVGLVTGSIALVADAGHMLTDAAGLGMALLAIRLAQRPATARQTYGFYRAEIIAAAVNGVLLLAVGGYVLVESYQRFRDPAEVPGLPVLVVATVGLFVNLGSASLLYRGAAESLNVRGAFLEVASDVLGSVGAITAGVILLTTGWEYADPLLASFVALLIVPRTWTLLREALAVLLESVPAHIDMEAVTGRMLAVPGVRSVHDLHIWTITSGYVALSGHVGVDEATDASDVLVRLHRLLSRDFGIEHITLQVESRDLEERIDAACGAPGGCAGPQPARESVVGAAKGGG